MESPHFQSQHSEIILNVSADHASSECSPGPKPSEPLGLAQSPIVEASQSDCLVPESVERVEDSYQDSLPNRLRPEPVANEDNEEDLYGVSPNGKASLDAIMASRRSAQKKQPTALPKRNAIDAFLEVGAAVPSSEQNVTTTSKGLAHAPPVDDGVALDANANINDANSLTTAQDYRTDTDCELRETGTEGHISGCDPGPDQSSEEVQATARRQSSHAGQPKQASKNSHHTYLSLDQPTRTIEVTEADASGAVVNNDEANSSKSEVHRQKHGYAAKTKLSTETEPVGPVKAAHEDTGAQEENIETSRPRRQAKQSALERLRAKNNKPDDEALDNTASDPADDGSEFEVPGGNGNQADKQLPTPITHGTAPKQAAGSGKHGKLKSVKPKHPAPTTNAKQGQGKTTGQDDLAKSGVSVGSNTSVNQEGNARSAATIIPTGPLSVRQKMQQTSREKSPPKRRGALKRPARAVSRGRRPQVEDRYAFPENTPGRKRKGRSVSKASKASTVKPGPTRQKMQSESVKERLDRAKSESRQPSVPREIHPKDSKTAGKDPRRTAAMNTKKPAQPPSIHESHGHRRHLTAASYQKPGSSQANAITIEQASNSSSSSSPSPRQRRNMQLKAKSQASNNQNDAVRPQTPAPVRSSPPGTVSGYTHVKDKPTIIAFGRNGPRNQGTASATREPRSASSAKVISGPILSKESTPFERGRKPKLPSEHPLRLSQPVLQSRKQTTTAAEPSNVATGNEDIFDAFTKNRKKKDLDNKDVPSAEIDTGSGQEDQNSGFAILDDFDDTTLVNENDPPAYSEVIKQPSASQLAMPPPKAASKGGARLKTVDASARIPKKEDKSVRARDTPRPISTQQGVSASLARDGPMPKSKIPPVIPVEVTGRLPPAAATKSATSTVKADFSEPRSVEPIGQGTRKRAQTVLQAGSPSKKRKSPPRKLIHEVTKDLKPTHAKPLSTSGLKVPQTGFLETLKNGPGRAREAGEDRNVQTGDPVKRSDRRKNRAGRRTTQGSQCVDILGSPYPKDLDVPTKTTALETYSQQADLSSDKIAASSTALERSLDLKAAPRMEPTLRPGLGSSNGKPIPAAPLESSKAVTRIASGPLAEQLLTARSADTSDNPFNTSSLVRRLNEPTVDRYKEALRQHGIVLDEDRTSARQRNGDEDLDDDTDMTLVEPINDARKNNRRAPGSPVASESSSASASTVDAATKVLEDVGDWRNTLKPHQTHLFDALVIAAHKLVRHMVDQETASRTIVANFRRRGEIIVTELQRAHAKEYQQHAQSLQGLKKQAADELAAYGRKLKQVVRDVEKARAERVKAASARSEVDERLKELVAGLE